MKRPRTELQVHLAHDREAAVWYIAKSDIPGLSLEADTPAELLRRIAEAAPELIDLNAGLLAEFVGAKSAAGDKQGRAVKGSRRPISLRPVFDAPLELAFA